MAEERSEIAFFDVETTIPTRPGQGFAILEFGAILVCPRKLVELRSYSTLVRPADLSHISTLSVRCNGITKETVVSAPTFADIADIVYDLLHGTLTLNSCVIAPFIGILLCVWEWEVASMSWYCHLFYLWLFFKRMIFYIYYSLWSTLVRIRDSRFFLIIKHGVLDIRWNNHNEEQFMEFTKNVHLLFLCVAIILHSG